MANKVRALSLMMKMMATRIPDLDRWEQDRDHPLIANGMLAQDNPDWLRTAERQEPNVLHTDPERSQRLPNVERMVI